MSVFARIAETIKKHPWIVIFVCLAITLCLGFGMLFLRGHVTYRAFSPRSSPA